MFWQEKVLFYLIWPNFFVFESYMASLSHREPLLVIRFLKKYLASFLIPLWDSEEQVKRLSELILVNSQLFACLQSLLEFIRTVYCCFLNKLDRGGNLCQRDGSKSEWILVYGRHSRTCIIVWERNRFDVKIRL